jgi:hypothetical protein
MTADPTHKCKHAEVGCGQYYDCGKCTREKHERIWRNLTPEQRAYDRMVDPFGAYTSGLSAPGGDRDLFEPAQGCSCHISPPCNYCVNLPADDEDSDADR